VRILRLAWRNLSRNRARTAITMAALALNTAILILSSGLSLGMRQEMTRNATQLVTGEVQLHAPTYLADRSLFKTLEDPKTMLRTGQHLGLKMAGRTYGYGLINLGNKSAGALFWGVDPEAERAVFRLAGHLEAGNFLPSKPENGLVLGKKLARALKAQVGSQLVVVVQAADGSLGNELFTVTGILRSVSEAADRSAALINLRDFRRLFVMDQGFHELAVTTQGRFPAQELAAILARREPAAEVRTWQELLPQLAFMMQALDAGWIIIKTVFFLAAGVGVMNTMLMATYERRHEFGVLKALGTSPWRIVRDVAVEAGLLGIMATGLGICLGVAVVLLSQYLGVDTRSLVGEYTLAGIAFDPVVRPILSVEGVVEPVVVLWFVCVGAALYPATMAARLDPVEILHHA
jgi:ABC-type lipoprotein release transport system permease subunit